MARAASRAASSRKAATAAPKSKKSAPRRNARQTTALSGEVKIGGRLKHARLVQKLRLRELADRLDCSESFLSKLENDKVRPSLAMLHRIVGILDINIAALFTDSTSDSPVSIVRSNARPEIRTDPLTQGRGIALECLVAAKPGGLIDANIHRVEAGGHTDGFIEHFGEEIGFVLEGELELTVEKVTYKLKAGDSFFFQSDLKHGYRNPGKVTTRVLWVNTPPTF
jgi:transcriptional regulator with XRE-family HTH domain